LRIGQVLNIPAQAGLATATPVFQRASVPPSPSRTYRVKNGDNLWQIAKDHKVAVKDVKQWNKLSGNNLRVGQVLTMHAGQASSGGSGGAPKKGATFYKVKPGDSLYLIAKRLKVPMKSLQSWNPKAGKNLTPGQTLTVYTTR
jgi:membrane-bound lytic murein transglycosylase D